MTTWGYESSVTKTLIKLGGVNLMVDPTAIECIEPARNDRGTVISTAARSYVTDAPFDDVIKALSKGMKEASR